MDVGKIRTSRVAAMFGAMALFFAIAVDAWAETGLDVEYSELQPLAEKSVLLDVARIGDRMVAVGERGHVIFSDNGTDWKQAEHVPTRSTLTAVFALGDRLWAGGHDAVIITSGDRGKTWSRQFFEPDRQQAVMDILFTDQDHGVAIGSYGLVLSTMDGGKTWTDETVDPENDYHLNSMVRFDDGRRMIAGEAGYSYRSFDDGETWEPLDLPYLGSMWGAVITPGDCVLFYGLRGHVMESCDFGMSWQELETGSLSSLAGGIYSDDLLVLVGNSGTVLVREDRNISEHLHSDGVDFAAIIPIEDGRFLLVGEEGVHFYPETVAEESGQ
ncbi:MAG: YCF48-related protein [Xanthomonadales bacterium]|nr:YCF48-related protein [Xanthomonadales bacterium]MDH3924905.1 YCF48-related protein [Xanthomonadales bacterium]MDH3941189.1 YCF48-related protein [Xanthomonadales bacterium]MDH4002312.1 YCF48-related protein [Xanthomonadales bacterium]